MRLLIIGREERRDRDLILDDPEIFIAVRLEDLQVVESTLFVGENSELVNRLADGVLIKRDGGRSGDELFGQRIELPFGIRMVERDFLLLESHGVGE